MLADFSFINEQIDTIHHAFKLQLRVEPESMVEVKDESGRVIVKVPNESAPFLGIEAADEAAV